MRRSPLATRLRRSPCSPRFSCYGRRDGPASRLRIFAAGLLAAYAAVIELQVGPVSAILGFYLLAQCLGARSATGCLAIFFVGALLPTVLLLIYNQLAFGSPWDMGYFHHATRQFAQVHNPDNPLGLTRPDWSKLVPLLWGRYRGLSFYAPILFLAVPGWVVLLIRRRWDVAIVSLLTVAAVFLVNLSYPEWTGGWSTGPRLLVPLLPFAMLPVAASLGLLAKGSLAERAAFYVALALALVGGVEMLMFQGVGARIPQDVEDPLGDIVWPLWSGQPLPLRWIGKRFCRNLVSMLASDWITKLAPARQFLQFIPLAPRTVAGNRGLGASRGGSQRRAMSFQARDNLGRSVVRIAGPLWVDGDPYASTERRVDTESPRSGRQDVTSGVSPRTTRHEFLRVTPH